MFEALERLIGAFETGRVVGARAGPYQRFETHGAVVLVSKEVAYKFKKPVKFDVFDYTSVEQRAEMCRREAELNRRLAPDIYLGAFPILETASGEFEIAEEARAGDENDCCEWLVTMMPVLKDHQLDRRVDLHLATEQELERVGIAIGEFHGEAAAVDPALGGVDRIRGRLNEHMANLTSGPAAIVDPARLEAIDRFLVAWLERHGDLLAERAEAGWIRDGHGDLRLEHVVAEDDRVQVIDCVEFDPDLRGCDVLADLSFLTMELELARRSDLAEALLRGWSSRGCVVDVRALWFYASLKALIRTEVAVHRAGQMQEGYALEAVQAMGRARLELAQALALRAHGPVAIVVGGLSGSGKTAVSRYLEERWGLVRVSSDEIRKQLVGVARDELAPESAYEDYVSEVVYENLGRLAAETVAAGRPVIVDATFRRPDDQRRFVDAYQRETDAPLMNFALAAHDDVLRTRVRDRSDAGGSDADITVLEEQLAARNAGREFLIAGQDIDTSAPVESVAAEIEAAMLQFFARSS